MGRPGRSVSGMAPCSHPAGAARSRAEEWSGEGRSAGLARGGLPRGLLGGGLLGGGLLRSRLLGGGLLRGRLLGRLLGRGLLGRLLVLVIGVGEDLRGGLTPTLLGRVDRALERREQVDHFTGGLGRGGRALDLAALDL